MLNREQHRLLYKIARSYYDENLTQEQIAKKFGISRPKVSRLLKQARNIKIVNISIVPPPSDLTGLEHKLENRYGLEEAAIISVSDPESLNVVAQELGPAAAEQLVRRISGNNIIGITWGTTMSAMVDALPLISFPDVTVVQITGGLGSATKQEHSAEIARRTAQKLNTKLQLLSAPAIVSNKEAAQALKSDKQIAETLKLAQQSNIAIMGIGTLQSSAELLRDSTFFGQNEFKKLAEAGAIGEIALRYINVRGEHLQTEINDRIIGLTFEQITKIPCIIAVAGGAEKYPVIRQLLKSRIINVLVTDHITAQKLDEN